MTKTNRKQTLQSDKVGGVHTIFVVDVINVKRVVSRYFFCCGNDFNLEMILFVVSCQLMDIRIACNM